MNSYSYKIYPILAGILLTAAISGCSVPTYYKEVTTKYDASGNTIGTEIKEGITQPDTSSSLMKVNITKQNKLEN